MKKAIVLFALLFWECHGETFDGFYFGANGGGKIALSQGYVRSSLGFFDLFPNITTHTIQEPCDTHHQSYFGSVYTGYGLSFCGLFAGIEGFINFPKHELIRQRFLDYRLNFGSEEEDFVRIRENLNQTLIATSRAVECGIDFKSGFLLTDYTLFYGRVGAGFNRFNFKSTSEAVYEDTSRGYVLPPELPSVSVTDPLFVHHYKEVTALRLGIGIEHLITQNWSLTLDYIYTYYGEVTLEGQRDTTVRDRTLQNGLKINAATHLRSNAILFGFCTRFCLSSLWYRCW